MMRAFLIILVTLAAAAEAQERSSWRSRRSADTDLPPEYQPIVDNNIFVRQRSRRPIEPVTRPAPLPPERSMVLTGIVLEEGLFRAYIEDTRSGTIQRVSPGDTVATGAVGQITIDAIAYESADGVRWIEIGQDLTGAIAMFGTRPTATSTAGGSTARPSGAGAAQAGAPGDAAASEGQAVDPSQMSIEERLRQRARQQRQR